MITMPGLRVGRRNACASCVAIAVTLVMTLFSGYSAVFRTRQYFGAADFGRIVLERFWGWPACLCLYSWLTSIGQSAGLMNAMVFDPATELQGLW